MKIHFQFKKNSTQVVITDCPHKKRSNSEMDSYIKVASASCALCIHNKGINFEKLEVECSK